MAIMAQGTWGRSVPWNLFKQICLLFTFGNPKWRTQRLSKSLHHVTKSCYHVSEVITNWGYAKREITKSLNYVCITTERDYKLGRLRDHKLGQKDYKLRPGKHSIAQAASCCTTSIFWRSLEQLFCKKNFR